MSTTRASFLLDHPGQFRNDHRRGVRDPFSVLKIALGERSMAEAYKIVDHSYDVVVVGAGGSGLRATMGAAEKGLKTACITKVFPTRSHTVARQGGIAASLGNMGPDHWTWHMYDTVKGSDWLGDQDAIEYMVPRGAGRGLRARACRRAVQPHQRGQDLQRAFGGHDAEYGRGARRPAHLRRRRPHRPRHAHALYQQSLQYDADFFIEYFALDLIMEMASAAASSRLPRKTARSTASAAMPSVLRPAATGRAYFTATSAHSCTGDAGAWRCVRGLPLQTWSSFQFHPTGIYGPGVLITEGARGEGGYLTNSKGERFMERLRSVAKDLASRDVVSRSMAIGDSRRARRRQEKDHI
jgi:succinate dehydrogenase / fumarate reductase flavoprotein subunit